MSEEQLSAFLEKLKDDTSLKDKLKAAADVDAAFAIAEEAGFSISADDLKIQSEISEEELEDAAGGYNLTLRDCKGCGTEGPWGTRQANNMTEDF